MEKKSINTDVIIIGAGAAGLMCAIEASRRGRSVIILEHNTKIGKKIRISGGGRCNFTNIHTTPNNFISQNQHFAKSALSRYTPDDFRNWMNVGNIPYHEKKLGQLFCDHSAQDVIDLLKNECSKNSVRIILESKIQQIQKNNTHFHTKSLHENFESENLVIATGGLSIPPLGATDFGYNLARQFGIDVTTCNPGLVPLTLNISDLDILKNLSGLSVDGIVSIQDISFRENILFTHKGLSGPAILQISSYWKPRTEIHINLLPNHDAVTLLTENSKQKTTLKNFLKQYIPARLAETLCDHYVDNKPLNQYSSKEFLTVGQTLNNWTLTPHGTEGYAKAEVTTGGIDTTELSSKTMESKKVDGLFFIGEVVDVTGHLGGFNFQWAWASGFAAGQYV